MAVDFTRDVTNEPAEQAATVKDVWEKPEILSYKPAVSAQGISYTPLDGLSNLTP